MQAPQAPLLPGEWNWILQGMRDIRLPENWEHSNFKQPSLLTKQPTEILAHTEALKLGHLTKGLDAQLMVLSKV